MAQWEERRILILGTTYPSYSRTYTETVCTGGIDERTGNLIRIHPVPHRYLEPEHRFQAFQWIRALVTKNTSDPRPESLRIDPHSIQLEEVIPSTDPDARRAILERSPQIFSSVEQLRAQQATDGTSLGIVKPLAVGEPQITIRTAKQRTEWFQIEQDVLSQCLLLGDQLKPIDFPAWRFMVNWRCDERACQGHRMGLSEWGVHELARKYLHAPDGKEKVLAAMRKQLTLTKRELYLFLGNYRTKLWNFGLMGSYSAPVSDQTNLFE